MNKLPRNPKEKGKKEFSLLNPKPDLEKLTLYLLFLLLPTQFGKHFWPPFSQILGIRIDYLSPTVYVTDILILALFLFWLKRQNILKKFQSLAGFLKKYRNQLSHSRNFPRHSRERGRHHEMGSTLVVNPVDTNNFSFIMNGKIGWLIFFTYLFLNTVFSNNLPLSLYGFLKILEMTFLGFCIGKNIKSKKELSTIAITLAFALLGESLLAIAQYIHQGSINGLLYFLGERKFTSLTPGIANASINGRLILRPYGTFPHPNVLAGFLLSAIVFIFAFLEVRLNKTKKILKTTALLLGSTALLLTLSRIAIILWILAILILLYNKLVKQPRLIPPSSTVIPPSFPIIPASSPVIPASSPVIPAKAGIHKINSPSLQLFSKVIFIAIFAICLIVFTPALPRLEGTRFTEKSFIQRTELLQSAITIIKTHPLFGVGLYNFLPSLNQIQKPTYQINELQPVHNIFLLITAETGIIGLIFFLWFLLETYKRLLKHRTATHNIFLNLVSIILILGLFDHYWLTLHQGQLLFALILGLCWAL